MSGILDSNPTAAGACPQCGRSSRHPFTVGGVCLLCAAERVLLGGDFSLPPPLEHAVKLSPGSVERIGVYEIIDEVGRGGMACVYAARQAGLGRIVALKALPEGRGGIAGLEMRFLREAQTAARLRHPNIVGVHDFGRADGQVYFTMDYIDGGDLARRLRETHFSPREAASLIHKVAGALAYTHGEGVLHRDLKPSNILMEGDEPRLADFGLAAQLEPGGDLTAVTGVLGTPHYLAPEALRGGSAALSAASDIYALGVILYEMLTGRTPYVGASPAELPGLIERREPPPPRLLAPAVPRDLSTICLKCLEREPARRYPTAAALADDLRRFLGGEPILARTPGFIEGFLRFARRHRLAFTAASAVALILVAATIVSTSLAIRATRAEQSAAAEARASKALADFLEHDLLAQASPGEQPDRDVKLRTVLDRAERKIDTRFPDEPLLEADIRKVIAEVYDSLGDYETELRHMDSAVRLRQRHLGDTHPLTLSVMSEKAGVLHNLGRLEESAALLTKTYDSQRRLLGLEHPDTLRTADNLVSSLRDLGRITEADTLQTTTLASARRVLGPRNPALLLGLSNLATIRLQQSRFPEAEALLQEAAGVQATVHGAEHPDTLTALNNLAVVYRDQGKLAEAAALDERILSVRRRVLGDEHHDTLIAMNNLAGVYKAQQRLAECEPLQATALDVARRTLGPEHHETLVFMGNLADTYRRRGKLDAAAALMSDTLALRRRVLGPTHPHTLITLDMLGDILLRQGRPAEAEPLLRESLGGRLKADAGNWMTASTRSQLGAALLRQNRLSEAEPLLEAGYQELKKLSAKIPSPRRYIIDEAGGVLAELYTAQGRTAEAATIRSQFQPPQSAARH